MLTSKKRGDSINDDNFQLPDLPPSNSSNFSPRIELPTLPNSEHNLPELPSVQEKIQSPENKKYNFKTIEMKEWTPPENPDNNSETSSNDLETIPDIPENLFSNTDVAPLTQHTAPSYTPQNVKQRTPITQDIFIKIDKFRSIRKALQDTQEKLEEIDSLLSKIREIKMREEQELSAWEKELAAAKSRINDINTNIFEKVR